MSPRVSRFFAVLAVLFAFAPASARADRLTGGTVALVNVRVVSMNPAERKTTQKRQTVIVEDGVITEIGKAKKVEVPDGAEVINGRNKLYVLPGLADMHVHNHGVLQIPEGITTEEVYTAYLANGVTTFFDLAGFDELFKWRREIERGRVIGPSIYFSTWPIDEEDYSSLAEVESDIRAWERRGYEYIKSHSVTTPAFLARIFELARELGLPVVGHAMRPGHPIQATLAEQPLMIAHIEEILSTSVGGLVDFRGQLAEPLRDVANSRAWVTGTVVTYETIAEIRDDETFAALLSRPEMRYVPPSVRQSWEFDNRYRRPGFSGTRAFWLDQLAVKLYIARELVALGALDRLLLGTDTGVDLIVPGFSLHDELRLLVSAGLTPWQAILTGTYNPAVFLGKQDEVGTVEEGKRADLLVTRKNPLRKIKELQNLAGVMVTGVWLSEAELDARLEALAARWDE